MATKLFSKFHQHVKFQSLFNQRSFQTKIKETEFPTFPHTDSKKHKRVYVWGFAETGALGLGLKHNKKRSVIKNPVRLSFAEKHKITDISCGFGFTVFAVDSHSDKLYGTGINTDSQIGYTVQAGKSLELLLQPVPIKLPSPFNEDSKVLKLSAGRAHLLVLTTEGLFTLGSNSYGQCGRSIIQDEDYRNNVVIHHIPDVEGQKIVDVQCGQDHSLLITENGAVFACGCGTDGQTGLEHYNIVSSFTRVKGDIFGERIIKIACSGDCVLALNDENEIFGWGNSEYGQFQLKGGAQQISIPTVLPFCKDLGKIVDIAAAGSFCMILNNDGEVYVWGYGLLGRGLDHTYPKPWLIPPVLLGRNDFQPENKVIGIACGVSHLAAVTNQGDLYMWGRNRNGCLGVGHTDDQCIPFKVSVGAPFLKVSCGLDHSVGICQSII